MNSFGYCRVSAHFFLLLALSIIWMSLASAKATRLDDSGTQAVEPVVSMRWQTAVPQRSPEGNVLTGVTTVRLRVNVAPWLRRSGRIYLALPVQQPGPIAASWSTRGRFLPGQLVSGNRALVYAGPITTALMEDVLHFQFSIDAGLMRRPYPVSFYFEIDEE
jgi:hypothetical protein